MENEGAGTVDLKSDLEALYSNFKWNFVGILTTDDEIIPIPKNSTCITAIIEQKALLILDKFAREKYGCTSTRPSSTREYPDTILRGGVFGNDIIAVDIKTARKEGRDRISGLTIGSYAGYFLHPDKKMKGCSLPYGAFKEHWIVAFLYEWNVKEDDERLVTGIECVASQKWKMASRSSGTGTTKHIGSVTLISDLRRGRGAFNSEKEFLEFWRVKGNALNNR